MEIESIENKKSLITGGLGLVGNNLARTLVHNGVIVSVLSKSLKNIQNISDIKDKIELIKGDVADYELIKKYAKDKEYIFHLAGQSSVPKSMENPMLDLQANCMSTLNILEVCRKYNRTAKIVFSGTVRESGPIKSKYADGNHRENPTSIFDLHKLTSEKYLKIYSKSYGLKTTTLRFSNIFGDVQYDTDPNISVINHFIKMAIKNRKLQVYGDGGPLRDHNYVDNVVDALMLAAQTNKTDGKHYVLGSGEGNSFFDFLIRLKHILEKEHGIKIEIKQVPTPEVVQKTAQGDVIVDFSQLNEDTGYNPRVTFDEGLNKTIEFYKNMLQ